MIWTGDLFVFYRFLLMIALGIYGLIKLGRALEWAAVWLFDPRREMILLRRYAMLQLLRVRLLRFWWDGLQIAGLVGVLLFLGWLHARLAYG